MLIAFPITFYAVTVVTLIVYGQTADLFWFRVALYANIAGVVTAALAAIPGAIDAFAGIPKRTRARSTALIHGALNSSALVLFAISASQLWQHRLERLPDTDVSLVLAVLGLVLTLAAGAFGWTLVQKHHVGVDTRSTEERNDQVPEGVSFRRHAP